MIGPVSSPSPEHAAAERKRRIALLFVGFSAYCSLNFELAVAKEQFAPKRAARAEAK